MGAYENRSILGKKEKIFLTGHTGFKGTWLTLLLEAMGHEVVGYSLEPTPDSLFERLERRGKIDETYSDIRDLEALKKSIKNANPSIVLHLAAQPLVLDSYKKPRETFETNAQGTANLLEASFATSTVKTIGAVTTDKVYKNLGTTHPYTETDALEGGSDPYSASKVAAEAVISAWKKISELQAGPKIVVLRSGNVIGGGDLSADRLIPDMVRSHLSGAPLIVRNPNGTRPWMHVLDSLNGYLKAIEFAVKNETSETYNFSPSDESLSVKDLITEALRQWPQMFDYSEGYRDESQKEAKLLNLDSTKATRDLNWNCSWTQQEATASSIIWWKMVLEEEASPKEICELELKRILND